MKSYNNLFEKVIDKENIRLAIKNSSRHKLKRREVKEVLANEEKHVDIIFNMLKNKTYTSPNHKIKIIKDGASKKERKIVVPRYKYEQIIHHAFMQVFMPVVEKGMYEYSCGSIPSRGQIYAKKYIEKYIRKNPKKVKYVLKMDVKKFFPSIPHDNLKDKFHKKVKDKNMCWLFDEIIDSYEDQEGRGIPIGFYTSQWIANWYLQDLDHFIKEKLGAGCYCRYMDDMVIFSSNKRTLHRYREEIEKYLNDLGLEMKSNWQVFRFDNRKGNGRFLDFVGFRFYREKTICRRRNYLKAVRKANKISKKKRITWRDSCQMLSLIGHFKHCNMYNTFKSRIEPKINVRRMKKQVGKYAREKVKTCI